MTQIVLLTTGTCDGRHYAYGPFADTDHARTFANVMTREVDPAATFVLIDPVDELLGIVQRGPSAPPKPDNWPPAAGTVWSDRHGDRWVASGDKGYLFRLNVPADDNADEVLRVYGPLTFVERIFPIVAAEECPF